MTHGGQAGPGRCPVTVAQPGRWSFFLPKLPHPVEQLPAWVLMKLPLSQPVGALYRFLGAELPTPILNRPLPQPC